MKSLPRAQKRQAPKILECRQSAGQSAVFSASLNRRPKDVGIPAIVIAELKFRNIEMQILFADLVIGPDDAALNERPKAFNRLCVDGADNVLMRAMVNCLVRISFLGKACVARSFVSAKQADLVRHGFIDEAGKGFAFNVLNDTSNDIALATNRANDDRLIVSFALSATGALVPMLVRGVAANERFVNLNNTAKLSNVLFVKGDSDLVAHKPSGLVRTEAQKSEYLKRAHTFLASQHQVDDAKPVFQRLVRVLKDCAGEVREAIASRAARRAFRALPMPFVRGQVIDRVIAAARAADPLRPAARDQIGAAIVLCLKEGIELRRRHLMNGLRALLFSHDHSPSIFGESHA